MQQEYDFHDIAPVQEMNAFEADRGILYVTDEPDGYQRLKAQGCYVVPYVHEGNRDAIFPDAHYIVEGLQELEREDLEGIYRRMAGLPWEILKTDRCLVRETIEADLDSFYTIYSDPSITKYMEDLCPDRQQALDYIRDYRKYVYDFYGYGMWTVLERQSGQVIGRAGLSMREGFEIPELGFVIGLPWQRQGYAYEVCEAILQLAGQELGMEQVQAFVLRENTPSARLCERLGFVRCGQKQLQDGRLYDRYEKMVTDCQVAENVAGSGKI